MFIKMFSLGPLEGSMVPVTYSEALPLQSSAYTQIGYLSASDKIETFKLYEKLQQK